MNVVETNRRRVEFLKTCAPETRRLHDPIAELNAGGTYLNPAGLGEKADLKAPLSAGGIAFPTVEAYERANNTGTEYGPVGTQYSVDVCKRFAELHHGAGASVFPSGLKAIDRLLRSIFPPDISNQAIMVPDCVYGPLLRLLAEDYPHVKIIKYSSRASGGEVDSLFSAAQGDGYDVPLFYVEAPGSQTFEIPDIEGIIAVAKRNGIKTAIDNSWASHVNATPIDWGVDFVVLATTKYEGGYGDAASGILVSASEEDAKAIAYRAKAAADGVVSPQLCSQLFNRVVSTEPRINGSYKSSHEIATWIKEERFVKDVIAPYVEGSPDFVRFNQYFRGGNGLFTIVLDETITPQQRNHFKEACNILLMTESWGMAQSTVLDADPSRDVDTVSGGLRLRFHIGLENVGDLKRDIEQASRLSFPALAR